VSKGRLYKPFDVADLLDALDGPLRPGVTSP